MRDIREPESSSDKEHVGTQVALCHLELPGGDPLCAEPVELGVEQVEHLVGVLGRRADRDGERAGVVVGAAVRPDRVGEAPVSRISWNSLLERPPPRTWLSTARAKRSGECRSGARTPRTSWACSVSRDSTTSGTVVAGGASRTRGGAAVPAGEAGLDARPRASRGRGRRRRRRPCCPAGSGRRRTNGSPAR